MRVKHVLLGIAAAVLFVPSFAAAQDLVLYEASETMKVKGNTMVRRVAQSALIGYANAGTALCPTVLGMPKCAVTAMAQDNVDLVTGKGPVSGTFAVVKQDENTADMPEQVVYQGNFVGQIDLSPAMLNATPLGSMAGVWTAKGIHPSVIGLAPSGNFTGTFRMPFKTPDGSSNYLSNTGIVPVGADERVGGWPMVKLEINFQ